MKKLIISTATAIVVLTLATASGGLAETNGGGSSVDAPGQAKAQANCVNVWRNIQLTLVAGGGPKSLPVVTIPGEPETTSGPTNCDHFWQGIGSIGQP